MHRTILAVIHDEDTADVQLDVIMLLLCTSFEHIEGSSLGAEENILEFELTLDRKILDGGVFFPVVGNGLVKGRVLALVDVVRFTHPQLFICC